MYNKNSIMYTFIYIYIIYIRLYYRSQQQYLIIKVGSYLLHINIYLLHLFWGNDNWRNDFRSFIVNLFAIYS